LSIAQGASGNEVVTVTTLTGVAAPVTVSLSTLPAGVTVLFTNNPCTPTAPCQVTAAIAAARTAAIVTNAVITVTGTSGSTTATTTFMLTVTPIPFAFTVSASPSTLSITQGGAAGVETLSATTTAGVAGPVVFSLSVLPTGVTVLFTPTTATCTPS